MVNIGWNESSPPDTESAGLGDDRIRSLTTAIRTGLDAEHAWPSAGGDAGVHRLGSGRVYYGPQSNVSSSGTDGKLMIASDSSNLWGVGSGGTVFFGGPKVITAGSYPGTPPQKHTWVEEFGNGITNSSGQTVVTFPSSGFSGVPNVSAIQLDPATVGAASVLYWSSVGQTSGTVTAISVVGASSQSSVVFHWRSIGSRTF